VNSIVMLAALVLLQQPGPVDAIWSRHSENVRKAKTFDEITAVARKTLAEIVALIDSKPEAETAARARAIAVDISADLEDYAAAEGHARKFLEEYPKHSQVPLLKMNLGQILSAAGKDAEAREVYQAFVRDHATDTRAVAARVRVAQSYLCERKDEEALKELTALRNENKGKPDEWPLVLQQALALQIAGKPGEGRALLEEAVKTCPDTRMVDFAKHVLSTWLWIGKPAKPIEGWNVKGEPLKLDITGGKVTVLYFLGSAFPDFATEAGVMRKLWKRFPATDFAILAVAVDKDKPKHETDLARTGVTWPVVFDGNGFKGPIASAYGIASLPMVLVIDRKNNVRFVNPIFGDNARDIGRCVEMLIAEK
jgi:peroxiredoxin